MAKDSTSNNAVRGPGRRLWAGLFRARFSGFVAADAAPVIYRFGVAAAGVATLAIIVWALRTSWLAGMAWGLILGPMLFVTLVVALRLVLEFMLAVFRMTHDLRALEARLGEVVRELREADQILGHVDYNVESVDRRIEAIQNEIPRLTFWRKAGDKKPR